MHFQSILEAFNAANNHVNPPSRHKQFVKNTKRETKSYRNQNHHKHELYDCLHRLATMPNFSV